jgi:hypothetical protein
VHLNEHINAADSHADADAPAHSVASPDGHAVGEGHAAIVTVADAAAVLHSAAPTAPPPATSGLKRRSVCECGVPPAARRRVRARQARPAAVSSSLALRDLASRINSQPGASASEHVTSFPIWMQSAAVCLGTSRVTVVDPLLLCPTSAAC